MQYINFPIIGFFIFLFCAEYLFPLRENKAPVNGLLIPSHEYNVWTWKRALINIGVGFTWLIVLNLIFREPITELVNHFAILRGGILPRLFALLSPWVNFHWIVFALCSYLILDYVTYWWHRSNHEIKFLRKYHSTHHSDLKVDATSTFRFHWVELSIHFLLKTIVAILIGINMSDLLTFEALLVFAGLFHHSNIVLPRFVQKLLEPWLVTPIYHLNHHFVDLNKANSNYCALLTIWDKIHHTYTTPVAHNEYVNPEKQIQSGLIFGVKKTL